MNGTLRLTIVPLTLREANTFVERNTVLSIARATATPDEAPRPPWGSVSSGIGGTREPGPIHSLCAEVDDITGAVCSRTPGHGPDHLSEDEGGTEVGWPLSDDQLLWGVVDE